ncbi:MAG: flavodoxin [Thermoleophilia bacterium]|nr:flavodoxin [Thermoleophilia bacterium]
MDRPPPCVLVVVAGGDGATRAIAEALVQDMRHAGLDARAEPAEAAPGPDGCDAVVIASAVHHGRWQTPARRYAARHAAVLSSLPVWLLSSGPLGAGPPGGDPPGVAAVRLMTGAREHLTVGGRPERDPGARQRVVVAPDGEGRDRAPVAALAAGIAGALTGGAAS